MSLQVYFSDRKCLNLHPITIEKHKCLKYISTGETRCFFVRNKIPTLWKYPKNSMQEQSKLHFVASTDNSFHQCVGFHAFLICFLSRYSMWLDTIKRVYILHYHQRRINFSPIFSKSECRERKRERAPSDGELRARSQMQFLFSQALFLPCTQCMLYRVVRVHD